MSVYIEMEYFSGKHLRDMKYHGFIANMPEFGYLLERQDIHPEDIKSLAIDGQEQPEAAAIAQKARERLHELS